MDESASFGYWVRRRHKALDLTQEELARQVGCASGTIRKIEADERRPSRQIAEKLAEVLALAPEERPASGSPRTWPSWPRMRRPSPA